MRRARAVLIMVALLATTSCGTLRYAAQAARGQWELASAARPIAAWIADPATDPGLRARLQRVVELREFAARDLHLPVSDRYRAYAALGRDYVLWNVFATPALSLDPIQACYPLLGCFDYRGYFAEAAAAAHARELRAAGHDVYVGGVAAYSTLGWFADPVLDSMLRYDDAEFARVLFHELAHGQLYVRDDTAFNEAYATAVADAGLSRYLRTLPAARAREFRHAARRDADFLALLLEVRGELLAVYRAPITDAEKLDRKRAVLGSLARRYADWKARWDDYAGYDAYVGAGLNNAHFAALASYHEFTPAFRALLRLVGGDLAPFYGQARALGGLPRTERHRCLRLLAADPARFVAEPPVAAQCSALVAE